MDTSDNEYIFADYSGEFAQLKDDNGYYTFDCVAAAIYNYNLITNTMPIQRGEHLIVIKTAGTYFCKKLNINPQGDNAVYEFNLVQTGNNGKSDNVVWF